MRRWMGDGQHCGSGAGPAGGGGRGRRDGVVAAVVVACVWGLGTIPAVSAAAGTWSATASLRDGRALHTATALGDGTVLVTGGRGEGGAILDSAELYDPTTERWSRTSPMSRARVGHSATRLADDKVLVVGGYTGTTGGGEAVIRTAEVYDPATGRWSSAGATEAPRAYHSATLLAATGTVLVAGGENAATLGSGPGESLSSAEMYDPAAAAAARWKPAASLGAGRDRHSATALNSGKVLVVGGYRGFGFDEHPEGSLAPPELYDPAAGAWAPAADNFIRRKNHTAVALGDGTVLVTGGYGSTGDVISGVVAPTASSEVYAPATSRPASPGAGTWKLVGMLAEARAGHSATVLGSGRVLVVGGFGKDAQPLASAELFDPSAGRWSDAGALSAPRGLHTATALAAPPCATGCPEVVVAGGGLNLLGAGASSSSQLYTPVAEVSAVSPPGGPTTGGTAVTITGSSFTRASAVRFGDVAATYTVASSTRITAVSPPHAAGAVDVTVTTPAGTSPTSANARFTYADATLAPGGGGGPVPPGPPIVGSRPGYWTVAADGGIFAFGDAVFRGSTGALRLAQPVVGMAPTPSGAGYWLVAADGGIFAFGDAVFRGSTGALRLNRPVVGMARRA